MSSLVNDNPNLKYKVIRGRNPRTGEEIWYPTIVNRQGMTTEQVLRRAFARQQIRGQFYDMLGVINGFLCALQEVVGEGYSVQIGDWFEIFLNLTGTVKDSGSSITDSNGMRTAIRALNDLLVNIKDFDLENITDTAHAIYVSYIKSMEATATAGKVIKGKKIKVRGYNMLSLDGDSYIVSWPGEDGETMSITLTPESWEVDEMVFPWPSTLDAVALGTVLTFRFRTRGGIADAPYRTAERTATLVAAVA